GRLRLVAPVALEDVAAAHQQLALLAGGEIAILAVDDAQRDAWQRRADGAGEALAGVGVRQQHAGLGHAVALEDAVAGGGGEAVEGLGRERGAAAAEEAHAAEAVAGALGLERVDEPHVHRRYAEE